MGQRRAAHLQAEEALAEARRKEEGDADGSQHARRREEEEVAER